MGRMLYDCAGNILKALNTIPEEWELAFSNLSVDCDVPFKSSDIPLQ